MVLWFEGKFAVGQFACWLSLCPVQALPLLACIAKRARLVLVGLYLASSKLIAIGTCGGEAVVRVHVVVVVVVTFVVDVLVACPVLSWWYYVPAGRLKSAIWRGRKGRGKGGKRA